MKVERYGIFARDDTEICLGTCGSFTDALRIYGNRDDVVIVKLIGQIPDNEPRRVLPCPFCGEKSKITFLWHHGPSEYTAYIRCDKCRATGGEAEGSVLKKCNEKAVENWNKRAQCAEG